MATLNFRNKTIYYEVHGKGSPLIILNGIMMNTKSWHMFLEDLKGFQVILLDFLDQGQSSPMDDWYDHDVQVDVLRHLIKSLDIKTVHLYGISYGAQIALQYAIKYPVEKLMVSNAAAYTTPWLKDIGEAWSLAAETYDPELFYHVAIPYIYSHLFYNSQYPWMSERKVQLMQAFDQPFLDAMRRLIKSSESYDIKDELYKIQGATAVIGSEFDYLTPVSESIQIAEKIKDSIFYMIQNCGHASMYEKPDIFIQKIKDHFQ